MIVYAAYRNADMTEGRGPYVVDKIFSEKKFAEDYIDTQPGVMGRAGKWSNMRSGDWLIKEHELITENLVDLEKLKEEKRIYALSKLTSEEKKLLGLNNE